MTKKDKREYDRIEAKIEKVWKKQDSLRVELDSLLSDQGRLLSRIAKRTGTDSQGRKDG